MGAVNDVTVWTADVLEELSELSGKVIIVSFRVMVLVVVHVVVVIGCGLLAGLAVVMEALEINDRDLLAPVDNEFTTPSELKGVVIATEIGCGKCG